MTLRNDEKRAKERARAILEQIRKAGFETEVTDLGKKVFGLVVLENRKTKIRKR
jgi:phage replication-related protein YjqB (UPF0714/DUF867 family)